MLRDSASKRHGLGDGRTFKMFPTIEAAEEANAKTCGFLFLFAGRIKSPFMSVRGFHANGCRYGDSAP